MAFRPLVLTWAVLMALTAFAGLAAGVTAREPPGAAGLTLLAVVTALKARLILSRYLRLGEAPAFLAAMTAAVVVVLAIVTLSFVVDFRVAPLSSPKAAAAAATSLGR